ncbi:TIGR01777 family oxidoreductase [Arachidicoccus terrestris]|uniref:TIGR01777 family oxidoreductase n=1 Tax=Arachidicoccus terrestris TaxID=2875539 RepID=UPI001CC7F77B|nr:TIGR01777 family oxidoreductase [Arachidicoccus terrestris]UAY55878.1 TIGR01777 family oxidoreductase [Arachidicoccus terrestris]
MSAQKKIILAGGTGFIGRHLQEFYQRLGYQILVISRNNGDLRWSDTAGIVSALENAELVVNLAGKSVDCRYTEKNKARVFSSRLETTRTLGEAILACQNPPKLWINSSTATIYRHAEDRKMTEKDGEIGTGFSVEVGKAWEKAFFSFQLPATRQAALRIAIVLGTDGGALAPYVRMARFGVGGPQGNGREMFSWIHIDDVVRIVRFLEQRQLSGVFNTAAPHAVDNKTLMRLLRQQVKMPIGLPIPAPLLRLGAGIIGTSSELLLKSRWVYPEHLLKNGFTFLYSNLEDALAELLGKDRKG